MAQKYEKQLVVKIEGSATAVDGVKGLSINDTFHSFDDIFAKLSKGDIVKLSINSELDLEDEE